MNKTRIEWTDYTWNPIKGLCPVGCWYCYARRMYKRFGWNPEVRYELADLGIIYDLKGKEYSKIFVSSTIELFHPQIEESWRNFIFNTIEDHPQHTFQILTKFPQNIDRAMPDNVWLGVTITGHPYNNLLKGLNNNYAKIKFVSFEPVLQPISCFFESTWSQIDWIIVGRLTGYGHKYDPPKSWIEDIIKTARKYNIPLFLKDNLKEIWGEKLIQEFPK